MTDDEIRAQLAAAATIQNMRDSFQLPQPANEARQGARPDQAEQLARLRVLLREGLDLASRVDDDDPITPALRDWHHEATMYLQRTT